MNRLLMIGSLAALLVGTTGCLHHNTRGGCNSCQTGQCNTGNCYGEGGASCGPQCGGCNTCQAGPYAYGNGGKCVGDGCNGQCGTGMCGRVGGMCGVCGESGCRPGSIPGRLGWGQGGPGYSAHLQPGCLGHHAGDALNSRPFTPGPPTAAVGYPYYTIRGPRDCLLDNPPSIGN